MVGFVCSIKVVVASVKGRAVDTAERETLHLEAPSRARVGGGAARYARAARAAAALELSVDVEDEQQGVLHVAARACMRNAGRARVNHLDRRECRPGATTREA